MCPNNAVSRELKLKQNSPHSQELECHIMCPNNAVSRELKPET